METLPGSATVGADGDVAGGGGAAVCEGEAVDHDLVDGAGSPEVGGGAICGGDESEEENNNDKTGLKWAHDDSMRRWMMKLDIFCI